MSRLNGKLAKVAIVGVFGIALSAPAFGQQSDATDAGLASKAIASGEATQAISMLESELRRYPGDPALLINLGIAHAHVGDEAEARAMFEAAVEARENVELETANGRTTDSRRLARQALAMLDRGEFRATTAQADQLTLRD